MNHAQVAYLLPILTAFAKGEAIEFCINGSNWLPCDESPDLELDWEGIEYRIKPKTVVVHYRNYLMSSPNGPVVYAVNQSAQADPSKYSGFIRYLDDDWNEVEV